MGAWSGLWKTFNLENYNGRIFTNYTWVRISPLNGQIWKFSRLEGLDWVLAQRKLKSVCHCMDALCCIHLLTLLPHPWLWEGACDWSLRRLSRRPQLCNINRTTLHYCYSSVDHVVIKSQQWLDYLSLVTPTRLSPFTSRIWSPGNRLPVREMSNELCPLTHSGGLSYKKNLFYKVSYNGGESFLCFNKDEDWQEQRIHSVRLTETK